MSTTIICIELPDQIPAAMDAVHRHKISDYTLLALTPHVEYQLEKMAKGCIRPEDHHSEEDIEGVGLEDLSTVEQFCDIVDQALGRRWDLLRNHGILPARMHWYYLKTLINSVSIRSFITRKVLEDVSPEQVIYFPTKGEAVSRELFFVHESVWSLVIPTVSAAMGISSVPIGNYKDPAVLNEPPKGWPLSLLAKARGLALRRLRNSLIRRWQRALTRAPLHGSRSLIIPKGRRQDSRPTILTTGPSYSLHYLLQKIESKGEFRILCWDLPRSLSPVYLDGGKCPQISPNEVPMSMAALRKTGRAMWDEIKNLPEVRQLLTLWSTDCFSVVENRLQRFFERNIPDIVSAYFRAEALIKAEQPFVLLESTPSWPDIQAVALAARQQGVPFVVYRHGSSSGFVKMETASHHVIEHVELWQADYVLAFGEGEVRYLEKSNPGNARILPIGSSVLDEVKKHLSKSSRDVLHRRWGLDPKKRTIMYVPTTMDGTIRIAPYSNRSPSRMFELQRRLLEIFEEFPHVQLVVKLPVPSVHPTSPIAQLVRDRHLNNVTVMTEPFLSVLPMADIFVTDFPSTPFVEMLTTDRPILLCGYQFPMPWAPGKWHPSVLDMWKERVEYADGLDGFLELLRTYITKDEVTTVHSSNTMLKLFGTHLDDGHSVKRAYSLLDSLALRQQMRVQTDVQTPGGCE